MKCEKEENSREIKNSQHTHGCDNDKLNRYSTREVLVKLSLETKRSSKCTILGTCVKSLVRSMV